MTVKLVIATENTKRAIRDSFNRFQRESGGPNMNPKMYPGGSPNLNYFKAVRMSTTQIYIMNGMDQNDVNCGYVQCNKLAAQAVPVQELTISANCYIFRKSVGSYTLGILSSAAVTFELLTAFPTYTAGTQYELKSVVLFYVCYFMFLVMSMLTIFLVKVTVKGVWVLNTHL